MTLSEAKFEFCLDSRLSDTTIHIGDLPLSKVLLSNNSLFPWIILVPRRKDVSEIIDLNDKDRHILMDEISKISKVMQDVYSPDKLNVAALGNQVKQLHVHIVARYATDDAWPDPIWGKGSKEYTKERLQEVVDIFKLRLSNN